MDTEYVYFKYRAELIQVVRDNRILWDKKHHLYRQKALKIPVWKRLAQRFGTTSLQLREIWQKLRNQYHANLSRELLDGLKPKWKFYHEMSFLRDSTIIGKTNKASMDITMYILKNLETTVSNSDKDFQDLDMDDAQLCEVAEQKEADSCIIEEWIKTEIDLDEEIKAENVTFDNESTDQAPEESNMRSTTRQQIMVYIPPTSSTPIRTSSRKRCRVENEECNATGKMNAVSQIAKRNTSELLAVHTTEGVKCDTNIGNGESQAKNNERDKEIYIDKDDCGLQKRYMATQRQTCVDKQVRDSPEVLTSEPSERIERCKRPPAEVEVKECQIDNVDTSIKYLKKKKNKKIKAKQDMEQNDDDYHFVISLLPYLRRVNLERKLQTRMDMMKIVMDGLKCYDK